VLQTIVTGGTLLVYYTGDQNISVHLMMYCNRQLHRDCLITLYYAPDFIAAIFKLGET
jgi:hypothetical protein